VRQDSPGKIFRSRNGQANRLRAELERQHAQGMRLRQLARDVDGALFFDRDQKAIQKIYLESVDFLRGYMSDSYKQEAKAVFIKILTYADWEKWDHWMVPEGHTVHWHNSLLTPEETAAIAVARSKAGKSISFKETLDYMIVHQYNLHVAKTLQTGDTFWQQFGIDKLNHAVESFFDNGALYREFNNESQLANWPGQVLAYTDTLIGDAATPKKILETARKIQSKIAQVQADHEEAALRNARAPFLRPTV